MSSIDWLSTTATAVVGIVGIAATIFVSSRGQRHAERLAALARKSDDRRRQLTFHSEMVSAGRRLQRASIAWTEHQTAATAQFFDDALEAFALLSAQSRLIDPPGIHSAALIFESTFRAHRAQMNPRKSNDPGFRLSGLISAIRRHTVDAEAAGAPSS